MKQYLSAAALILRPAIGFILAVLIIMSACQFLIFRNELDKAAADYEFNQKTFTEADQAAGKLMPGSLPFEYMIDRSSVKYPLVFAFVAICLICAWVGGGFGSTRTDYTLRRLPISEKEIHTVWAACYALIFALLLVWQTCTLLALMYVYSRSPLGFVFHGQSLYLAFWRCQLLHSVMPIGDLIMTARNIILCISLGITASCFSYRLRRGTKLPLAFPLQMSFGMTTFTGAHSWVELSFIGIAFSLVTVYFALSNAWRDQYEG